MYKKFISAFKLFDTLIQALYSLALPIGIGALVSYLLTKYASCPPWIWAVLMIIGTLCGFYSMVKYVLSAMANMERVEKQREAERKAEEEKEKKHSELRMLAEERKRKKNGDGE